MKTHVTLYGIAHIIFGALQALGALIALAAQAFIIELIAGVMQQAAAAEGSGLEAVPEELAGALRIAILVLAVVFGAFGVLQVVLGVGLMRVRPWARIAGIVAGVLLLPGFPVGTMVGAYGLWALLNDEGKALFEGARSGPVTGSVPSSFG